VVVFRQAELAASIGFRMRHDAAGMTLHFNGGGGNRPPERVLYRSNQWTRPKGVLTGPCRIENEQYQDRGNNYPGQGLTNS
jgi:hypothetical protein